VGARGSEQWRRVVNVCRGEVRLTVIAEQHAAQFPQFKASLQAAAAAATFTSMRSSSRTDDEADDSMSASLRHTRLRQGRRRPRRVGVATLADNEIVGNCIPLTA